MISSDFSSIVRLLRSLPYLNKLTIFKKPKFWIFWIVYVWTFECLTIKIFPSNDFHNIFLIFYKQNWVTMCKFYIQSMPQLFFLPPASRVLLSALTSVQKVHFKPHRNHWISIFFRMQGLLTKGCFKNKNPMIQVITFFLFFLSNACSIR